jgi:hypothetical protein
MRVGAASFAVVLLSLPAPAVAQVTDTKMVESWFSAKMTSTKLGFTNCIVSRTFGDGTKLEITMGTVDTGPRKIEFSNADWQTLNSVKLGGGDTADPTIPITMTFEGGQTGEFTYDFKVVPQLKFQGVVVKDEPSFYRIFPDNEFLSTLVAMARSNSLRVTSGERVIGRWTLAGSKAAIGALTDCVDEDIAMKKRRESNDPFRN